MELHAGDVAALHDGGERLAVLGDGDGVAGHRRDVAVREVDLRAVGARRRRSTSSRCERQAVPADVRNLDRSGCGRRDRAPASRYAAMPARQQPEARQSGASSLPSNSHCMPRQMPSSGRPSPTRVEDRVDPRVVERPRRAEVSDARHDDAARLRELVRPRPARTRRRRSSASAFFTDVRLPAL